MNRARIALLTIAAAALLSLALLAAPDEAPPPAPGSGMAMEPEYIGAETCATCHDDVEGPLARTPHGSAAFAELSDRGCETCHGPGSLHMEDPEDPTHQLQLSRWTAQREAEVCLGCHAKDHPRFAASEHARIGMACSSCHSIHGESGWTVEADDEAPFSTARITGSSAMCAECHLDVAADFELTERHRLQEGILDCVSCHDPHAPATRVRLGSFKQDACVKCHADKGGPFVFEHGGVRVEGCTACHTTPHGSPNRHLLAHQNVAELCYSCHVEVPGFHIAAGRFSLDTRCTNCHSSIHGSNFSPVFFK